MDILHQMGIRGPIVLIQLVGFLLMMLVLKTFLFDRVKAFMAARDAEEDRQQGEVAQAKKALEEAEQRLRARLAESEKRTYDHVQAEIKAGVEKKAALVGEAQERARRELGEVRKQVEVDRVAALARIREDIAGLALFAAGDAMGAELDEKKHGAVASKAVAAALGGKS